MSVSRQLIETAAAIVFTVAAAAFISSITAWPFVGW